MITITGLTERQKTIMDLLWGCSSLEQVQTLIAAMPTASDRRDAAALITIATQETIELELGLDDYEDAAKALIHRCML
jgi:hypothetical protein